MQDIKSKIACRIVKKFGLCAGCDAKIPCAAARTILEELEGYIVRK